MLAVDWGMSGAGQLEHLQVVFLCGLDWASSQHGCWIQKMSIPRKPSGNEWHFYYIATEVTEGHFTKCWLNHSQRSIYVQGDREETLPLDGKVSLWKMKYYCAHSCEITTPSDRMVKTVPRSWLSPDDY
jgi:hypothetical protein